MMVRLIDWIGVWKYKDLLGIKFDIQQSSGSAKHALRLTAQISYQYTENASKAVELFVITLSIPKYYKALN